MYEQAGIQLFSFAVPGFISEFQRIRKVPNVIWIANSIKVYCTTCFISQF